MVFWKIQNRYMSISIYKNLTQVSIDVSKIIVYSMKQHQIRLSEFILFQNQYASTNGHSKTFEIYVWFEYNINASYFNTFQNTFMLRAAQPN